MKDYRSVPPKKRRMDRSYPTPATGVRSKIMAAVRSRGNESTELRTARLLRKAHLTGWRRHLSILGTPDFAWPRLRVALFVDGCFWHGCPKCYRLPKHNRAYWRRKVRRNRKHDRHIASSLRSKGWIVVRAWECKSDKVLTSSVTRALLEAAREGRGQQGA